MKTWELVLALVITAPFGQSCIDAAHRELDLSEKPAPCVRPQFLHSHVEATWRGWQARAAWQCTQAAKTNRGQRR